MFRKWIIFLIINLMMVQTVPAVIDLHLPSPPSSTGNLDHHTESDHTHAQADLLIAASVENYADYDDYDNHDGQTSTDHECHRCGHCHGNHLPAVTVSTLNQDLDSNNHSFSNYHPFNLQNTLTNIYRPPII